MERQIERALRPGEFIHDRACFSFVSGLDQIANDIEKIVALSHRPSFRGQF